ncbi:CreA family protein [Leucothrix pacifica]|uniref:CREA protein n=1 Tax=Leucothrix pacifica TaxID=1247513 RepID=A0A317CD22_9GAMM|nr:CreA family protein [Leucothrix pacifica]PWQ96575.1 CREA protein [Leucothrix pacifica]
MNKRHVTVLSTLLGCGFSLIASSLVIADEVGDVNVDWLGSDIKIEAIEDPKVKGVTCHVSYFDRGLIERFRNGDVFSDPSNSSISCRQTGPLVIGDIEKDDGGESVFSKRTSLVVKSLKVTRIYDEENKTLIYLSHATELQNGSAKMSLSTVPLYGQDVTWTEE